MGFPQIPSKFTPINGNALKYPQSCMAHLSINTQYSEVHPPPHKSAAVHCRLLKLNTLSPARQTSAQLSFIIAVSVNS